jgi:hypothetical protein
MTGHTPAPLDGNAAAGQLSDIFTVEVTAALGSCAACGARRPLGEAGVYLQAPGLVLRCRGCDGVILRVVTAPDRQWVDLRGLAGLEIAR